MAMLPSDVPRDAVIVTRNLQREYDMGGEIVRALRGVDLTIRKNEFVAVMGPSGSGKSTLMNLIGCLDSPTAGEYWLNGHRVSELEDDELARIRNKEIGKRLTISEKTVKSHLNNIFRKLRVDNRFAVGLYSLDRDRERA